MIQSNQSVIQHIENCKVCSSKGIIHCKKYARITGSFDKETIRKFKVMCDLWIQSLLTERRNSNT